MEDSAGPTISSRLRLLLFPVVLAIAAFVTVKQFQAGTGEAVATATYTRGIIDLAVPYHAPHAGAGQLTMEVLDPEDHVLGRLDQSVDVAEGAGHWLEKIKLTKPVPLDDLVWHRVRYRFEFRDDKTTSIEGTESISQILRMPVIHILGQQSYLAGGEAAVRVIVTDSHDAVIAGRGAVKIEFVAADNKASPLFTGQLNRRGTTEAQFRFPAGLVGDSEAPTNTAEIALNVERYVLPKFKVAVDFTGSDGKTKRGYRPGDHVTGTVHANYFFGKPVDDAGITVKASGMDVSVVELASVQGKTDHEGGYHFDLQLPTYFAGRPLNQGAARVLIEAAVKDSADHTETRGQPITVSASPLLIIAVPEAGTLVPNLENQVFILTSYPDGTPARATLKVRPKGSPSQDATTRTTTDEGGIAIVNVTAGAGAETLQVEAEDQEGNQASSTVQLQTRDGEDQILLRTERAVYKAGDRINLKVFSTKKRGAAYLDIVKDGQTVLTRDLDIENGQAALSLTATPELAGTVDFSAYLFGRNAQPVGDHRLVFVQPADELKIDAVADAPIYRPGTEARIRFRVTNSRGEGVSAALGLQVVDEAVFALAEKQPGFAKVFFYLEQEVMKPRYEIHSIGMPEIVEPAEESKTEQRDRAARALFSATELVGENKFETEFGRTVPMTKYAEYAQRYRDHFQKQVNRLAEALSKAYALDPKMGNAVQIHQKILQACGPDCRDSWGNSLTFEPMRWDSTRTYYMVHSAGPDGQLNTSDDLQTYLLFNGRNPIAPLNSPTTAIQVKLEHDHGPFNGLAGITGTVTDPSGAVVPEANVEVREVTSGRTRNTKTNAAGQLFLPGVPAGKYVVQVTTRGFRVARQEVNLGARDLAVLSATLSVGQSTEVVEVSASSPVLQTEMAMMAVPAAGAAMGGPMRGVANLNIRAQNAMDLVELKQTGANSAILAKDDSAPSAHVRSYFPEALYINPEIITDQNGVASISIPLADSITTWRMAMLASTSHGALGSATSSLKVFQDFFVDLDLPVTLTQGDRVSIPVAVYNYSSARGDVSLKLRPEDWFSLVDDVSDKSVAVESSHVGGSQFTVQAQRIGKFKLTLSARMKGGAERADIVVREIEVIPNGREQNIVFNGRLENSVQHELNFPANTIPDASKIFVRLYPGPLSQVIEGMDSILRMPGGCFEQTSSSTYPNVLALDYMKRTKKLTPEVHAKAEGYIANGYQRLLTFEVPGGGFSWFGQAPANKILTAYGLMEFSDMSKVYDVDPRLISRTQQWLASQQQADGSWKPDTQFINEGATNRYNSDVLRITAYLAWSLENTGYQGPAIEKAKQFVDRHMSAKADAYTLAVVANFAVDSAAGDRDKDFTRQAMKLLLDARTEKDEQAWWSADETGVYSTGASASVETTGLAVQALLKWGEASGTSRKAMNYVASKKDASGSWGTTQATIMALRALLLATEKGAADVRGTLQILLNGKPLEHLTLTAENNDLLHQFVFKGVDLKSIASKHFDSQNVGSQNVDSKNRASDNSEIMEIRFEGKGGLAYQIVGSYFLPWDEKPASEPLSIEVAYDRARLAQDDIATATATIRNNLPKSANMVMVDLGIPPGFDLLSEDLQTYIEKSASQKSARLEKFSLTATQAILYFDSIAPGDTVTLHFRLRAKYPIRAHTFQSRVYEYYDPDVSSVARPVQLEVHQR